jgi:hypothetical protein
MAWRWVQAFMAAPSLVIDDLTEVVAEIEQHQFAVAQYVDFAQFALTSSRLIA